MIDICGNEEGEEFLRRYQILSCNSILQYLVIIRNHTNEEESFVFVELVC